MGEKRAKMNLFFVDKFFVHPLIFFKMDVAFLCCSFFFSGMDEISKVNKAELRKISHFDKGSRYPCKYVLKI